LFEFLDMGCLLKARWVRVFLGAIQSLITISLKVGASNDWVVRVKCSTVSRGHQAGMSKILQNRLQIVYAGRCLQLATTWTVPLEMNITGVTRELCGHEKSI
jgi:hypothetical protein